MLFSNLDSFFELNQDVRYLFLSRFLGCQIICLLSYFIEIVAIFMRKKKIKPFYRIGIFNSVLNLPVLVVINREL